MAATTTSPKPETGRPKPDANPLSPQPPPLPPLRDRGIRLVMIPIFGVGIPHLTGYFGPLGASDGRYWLGLLWANLISFSIWHGNRFLLIKQRQHYDWFDHPLRKLSMLVFASVFYTAPLTVVMMLAWYRMAGFGPDWDVIRIVALACVVCVIFITHVYETVYLIQQRESDLLAVERLERARTQAELEALKTQVTPHFLFNSLNTLSWLIENCPEKALEFNQNLAEVYRYILVSGQRQLVPFEEEAEFVQRYFALLKLRFEDSLELAAPDAGERGQSWFVPPISLQVLVENAVKHNEHSPQHPLRIELSFEEGSITVGNEKRPRLTPELTAGTGLKSLDERCRLALGRGIEVAEEAGRFTVRVPARVV